MPTRCSFDNEQKSHCSSWVFAKFSVLAFRTPFARKPYVISFGVRFSHIASLLAGGVRLMCFIKPLKQWIVVRYAQRIFSAV